MWMKRTWAVRHKEKDVGGTIKRLWAVMVEVRLRKKAPVPDPNLPSGQRPQHRGGQGHGVIAGRLRLQILPNRKQEKLEPFVQDNVQQGTEVRTDGWTGYDNLGKPGYRHKVILIQSDHTTTDPHLPMIHIAFGNLDAWLLGTHHGVSPKYLQGYLNEFVFRFNRRFWPLVAFDSVRKIAARVKPPTYEQLYKGMWDHPG
jgi:transposase-like protein